MLFTKLKEIEDRRLSVFITREISQITKQKFGRVLMGFMVCNIFFILFFRNFKWVLTTVIYICCDEGYE